MSIDSLRVYLGGLEEAGELERIKVEIHLSGRDTEKGISKDGLIN